MTSLLRRRQIPRLPGQDVSEKTLRDVSQAFTNRIEPRVYPTIDRLVTDDGKAYIRVEFSGDERPYACDGRYRIRFTYEEIPFGTKLTFHRNDPFAESLPNVAESLPDIAESPAWATLSDNERAVAELLAASGTMRTNEVAEMLDIPARTARYTLQKLVEKGVAEAHGSTRSRTYNIRAIRKA